MWEWFWTLHLSLPENINIVKRRLPIFVKQELQLVGTASIDTAILIFIMFWHGFRILKKKTTWIYVIILNDTVFSLVSNFCWRIFKVMPTDLSGLSRPFGGGGLRLRILPFLEVLHLPYHTEKLHKRNTNRGKVPVKRVLPNRFD